MALRDYIGEATAYDKKIRLERKSTRTDFFLILPNLNYGETINGIESSSEDTESGTVIKDTIDAVTEPTTKTVTKTTTKTITKPLSKEAREILKILAGNHSISAEQLGKVLGLSVSGVRYHIRALTKESLIRRVGSSKTGYWEVLE